MSAGRWRRPARRGTAPAAVAAEQNDVEFRSGIPAGGLLRLMQQPELFDAGGVPITLPSTDEVFYDPILEIPKRWDGSQWRIAGNGTYPPFPALTASNTLYVSSTGSDSANGLSWGTAYATVAAAVAALVAGSAYGEVVCGPGAFTLTDTLVLPQGIRLRGAGPMGASSGGTTLNYTGTDDGRAAIRTAKDYPGSGGYPDFSFGQVSNLRLTASAMTLAVGLEWRNAQNNSTVQDLYITGFGVGVYAYDNMPTAPNTYPGYVTARRVWCSGNVINWHLRSGFTSIHLDMCAWDGKSNTTDGVIIDPPLIGGKGRDLNLILTGCKSENTFNGSTGDCNGITVNTDAAISLDGCSMRQPQAGTKPWINYTVVPASSNSQSGTIPVKMVNCTTGNIPVTVKGPDGKTWLAPSTTAAGEVFQITEWSGGSEAPKSWRGTHSGLVADGLTVQPTSASSPGIHVDPPAGTTGNPLEVSTARIYDTFTRADSASVLGTPDTGTAWTASRGTWGISSNKGYLASATSDAAAFIDATAADGTLSCDITLSATAGAAFPGLQFRRVDLNNCLILRLKQSTGEVFLQKQVAGVQTTLTTTTTTLTPGATINVKIVLAGVLITVYLNGTLQTSYTLTGGDASTFTTPTGVGLRQNSGSAPNDDGGSRYDNFRFTSVSTYIDPAGVFHGFGLGSTTLAALTDVSATLPSNGDTLLYNTGTSKWTKGAPASVSTPVTVAPYFCAAGMGGGFFAQNGNIAANSANTGRGCRVRIPKTGTLHDVSVYVNVQSGNVDAAIFDTGDALAGSRTMLWHTGSIACPAAGAWQILGDPSLAVTAGQWLDFAMSVDNTTAKFLGGLATLSHTQFQLPTGFEPTPGGASPKMGWLGGAFPLATLTEAACVVQASVFIIIARIA